MPISLKDLRNRTGTVRHEFPDGSGDLTIEFRIGLASDEYLHKAAQGENSIAVDALPGLIIKWDLVDEDGEPVPITVEALKQIDNQFLKFVYNLVKEAEDPLLQRGRRLVPSS